MAVTLSAGKLHLPGGRVHEVPSSDAPSLPDWLRHLDTYAGRAVPFVQEREPLAGPHWQALDRHRVVYCLDENACAMCALPNDYELVLLVRAIDEATARTKRGNKVPPMHERCARYAAAACPYIAVNAHEWWLYVTRSVTRELFAGFPACVAAAPRRIVRLADPTGKMTGQVDVEVD